MAKSIVRLDGFSDERLDYLEIQVDRQTWDEVCAPATHPTEGGSDE